MTFLNPYVLLAGLAVALPIVAHLLNRYQVQHTPWAAMQFLNRSVRVRSRQLRLRDLLLLILRCFAVLLLALALARPATQNPDGSWLPGERRAGVVIALDASFSMQHHDGNSTRFERAVKQAGVISERIHTGDPVTLVLLGNEHRVVARNMAFEPVQFRAILQQQTASAESLDLDSVPKCLQELAEDMNTHQREVYLVSDVQAQVWDHRSDQLRNAMQDLSEIASVFVVPVLGNSDNLAVTNLEFVSGLLRKGTVARYQATVRNCGLSPVSDVEVQCRVDGVEIDSKLIRSIRPDSSETVSLFVPFHNVGATRITAEINGDSLETDNVRRAVAMVRDRVSVLCVDGSSGDTGRIIVSALLARDDGTEDEDYVVRSVPWLSLPAQDLENVDVIVLADVPDITSDQARQLSQHVRQGGGLVWFAGDQVKIAEWNERSAGQNMETGKAETPLLPAVIGQVVDSRDALGAGKPLDPSMPDHVLCRPLRSLPEDLLSETRFLKRLKVEPSATSVPVLNLAGSDSPILLEHTLGRGHVVMFTTSAEATWNNMALTPVFPMLMQQIVTYLAGREFEQPRLVGDSLSLAYTNEPDANNAVFDTPAEQTITVPVREYRDQYVALLENATEAGFYMARVSVQAPGMPIAVNVDCRESDVACLTESELSSSLEGTGIMVVATETDLLSSIEATRTGRSSWRFFMLAGLAVLLIESLFADHLLKRQWARQPKPDQSPTKDGVTVNA
ncbi:MAG: BatA domain-containing protein [Mariniblastus sp.]|nr:BatA domain-containing protein [Mariniblastus sp.]